MQKASASWKHKKTSKHKAARKGADDHQRCRVPGKRRGRAVKGPMGGGRILGDDGAGKRDRAIKSQSAKQKGSIHPHDHWTAVAEAHASGFFAGVSLGRVLNRGIADVREKTRGRFSGPGFYRREQKEIRDTQSRRYAAFLKTLAGIEKGLEDAAHGKIKTK